MKGLFYLRSPNQIIESVMESVKDRAKKISEKRIKYNKRVSNRNKLKKK